LTAINVDIRNYDDVYDDTSALTGVLLVDTNAINMALYDAISCEIVDEDNPTQYFKCIKNDIEIANTKNAHLKDGIAMTRFMYHLKHTIKDDADATEISIADTLESFRQQQPLYQGPSFDTICAYKDNAAIIHYHATSEHCSHVEASHMLMIDSGGQYLDGTTDITRTFVLGDTTAEERRGFTLVLKGFLQLMYATFKEGTYSNTLDFIAREPLLKEHLDFRHSTGHGVGHYLNVHEMPVLITNNPNHTMILEAGMVTSDEPGVYIEGHYGIRHENELLCVKDTTNDYGDYLRFEPLTLCPIDPDGIDYSLLTHEEIAMLNDYQQRIYDSLKDHLPDNERLWLKKLTQPYQH